MSKNMFKKIISIKKQPFYKSLNSYVNYLKSTDDPDEIQQDYLYLLPYLNEFGVHPENVSADFLYIVGRRLRQLYFWYSNNYSSDTEQQRENFNKYLITFTQYRTLNYKDKAKAVKESRKYQYLKYKILLEITENDLKYSRFFNPLKEQYYTLTNLVEVGQVVRSKLPTTFFMMEELFARNIVHNDNKDRFYQRLLFENDGSYLSVRDLLSNWLERKERI